MGAQSRTKGAAFEREVARDLFLLTGVGFARNLEQCRADVLGDLVADDPAFPFVIECKNHATLNGALSKWKAQAVAAATKAERFPAVVYKLNRQPIRVLITMHAILPTLPANEWAEITLPAFAALAAEVMARRHV